MPPEQPLSSVEDLYERQKSSRHKVIFNCYIDHIENLGAVTICFWTDA